MVSRKIIDVWYVVASTYVPTAERVGTTPLARTSLSLRDAQSGYSQNLTIGSAELAACQRLPTPLPTLSPHHEPPHHLTPPPLRRPGIIAGKQPASSSHRTMLWILVFGRHDDLLHPTFPCTPRDASTPLASVRCPALSVFDRHHPPIIPPRLRK